MNILRKQKGLALLIMMSGFFLLLLTLEFAVLGMTEITLHRVSYIKRKEVAYSLRDMGVVYARMLMDKYKNGNSDKIFPPESLKTTGNEILYMNYSASKDKKDREPDKIYVGQGKIEEVDTGKLEELMKNPDLEKLAEEACPPGINPADLELVLKDENTPYTTYKSPPLIEKGFFTLDYYYSGDTLLKIISTGHFEGVTCSVEVK